MKLHINFGMNGPKELISWWGALNDFPRIIEHKGSKWEWVMYNEDKNNQVDYILFFSEISYPNPNHWETAVKFEDLAKRTYGTKCDCGAIYTSFSWDHFRSCPKWVPWEKL